MRGALFALLLACAASGAAAQTAPQSPTGGARPLQCTGQMMPCAQVCTARYNQCLTIREGTICRPIQERCNAACRAQHCR